MAKNLKLNIKNAQLAEALKISKVIPKSRTKIKEETSTASEETEVKKAAVHKEVEPVIPPSTPKEKESVSFLEEARHYKAQANAAKFEPKATLPKESTVFGKNTDETETPSFQKNDKDLDDEKVKPSSTFKPRESNYTPREGTGQSYTPREGGFRPREAGSYTPREGGYKPREAGSYTPREGGYKPREAGSYTPREGGYKPREAGSYTPREGGFKPREAGSYTPREGGFKPREPGSYTPREGGFKPREAGSYTPREGGFRPREAGSFTPREGGFKPREAGAYTPREGGFRPAPGFQRPTSPSPLITPRAPGSNFTSGFRPVPATLPPSEKKTPSRVLDQEMGTKTKKVFSKDQKDSATKKRMDDKRSFNNQDRLGLRNDDQDSWRKKRTFKQKSSSQDESEIIRPKKLDVRVPITVKDLASMMKLKASQLIAKLFMQGVMITLNDFLEDETTIQLLGTEFDCDITIDTKEEDRIKITDKTIKQEIVDSLPENLILRAPVVAFMGHVDHGKTSLVDAIRKSNIAAGESGAITQHIGAFQCTTNHGLLTILDTPGHEAFNEMRARGADITDIVVLVIAGDEGIKPQTLEALSQARAAECPVVVAITKSDKPNFNLDNVYRQLADQDLLPEAWGGTTITVPCSSVNKTGISELLEMLALQSEILELKADPTMRARGTVIESEMHKGLGAVTTLLIQNGTLKIGDSVVIGEHFAKIKTMMNDHGQQVDSAAPSSPVKITGLSGLPSAGSEFVVVKNEKEAKELSEKRALGTRQLAMQTKRGSIESMLANSSEGVKKILPVILKADVQGSLEALKTSLTKIVTNKVELMFISASVGEISESDVALANASKAAIIGFHTDIESHAEPLIKEKHVKVIMQDVIYHVVDEVKLLMKAQLDKIAKEEISGKALIKAVFKASALGTIAGCQVTEGSIKRNNQVRVYRENEVIWKGHISSLKRVKDDVREATKGQECGIVLQGYNEFKDGDIIEGFDIIYLEQEL